MERKRSLSASSTDSWSVIDHRRTSSCDDTADEAEESVSLYFDEAIIADEAFASSDEDNEINESDAVEDSDIELAEENITDSDNEDAADADDDDDPQDEVEQESEEESEGDRENDSDWSSDEEEVIKESVWVEREDIRESGGLYFESPEHIKSNFDEIDRKEGWKLVSRVLTIYFSIIAVLLAVEAGLQMYKRNVPEPDYPVLIADIYGLQYRGVDFDSDDLPSFACIRNDSLSTKYENRLLSIKPMKRMNYQNSSIDAVHDSEIYNGFSTYLFKSFSPRRNSSRFQVLSRLVQSKPFTSPISFKSSLCYKTSIVPKVSNHTRFCHKWQQNLGNGKALLPQTQSVELRPQLVSSQKAPVYSNICVGQSNEQKRISRPMSASSYIPLEKSVSRKLKRHSMPANRLGPRAPEPVYKKQSKILTALPSRRIRLAKPNILIAPPRNRLTLPKHSNLSMTPSQTVFSSSRSYMLKQNNRKALRAICSKSAPKPSLVKSLPPIKYRAPKPVRYSVGPVTEKSLVPCHPQKSYLPVHRKNKLRLSKPSYMSSHERASNALHGLYINKTSQRSDQCDSRYWNLKKHQLDKRRAKARKGIDHKTPTPCAAKYTIESSVAERKQYHLSERRSYRNQGSIRNSSFARNGCSKSKAVVPAKKALLPKCRSESKPRKGKEIKPKSMCKHRVRFD
ncbi:unnamed protein product [Auanema sp. JU1783]|nr:unnamed protein product [Auanema sp. JU1783]